MFGGKRAQFDFELSMLGIIYGLIGAAISYFTITGGFVGGHNPGVFLKIITPIFAFIIGYVWGMKQES